MQNGSSLWANRLLGVYAKRKQFMGKPFAGRLCKTEAVYGQTVCWAFMSKTETQLNRRYERLHHLQVRAYGLL